MVAAAGALLAVAGTAEYLPAVLYATAAAAAADAVVMASPAARLAYYDAGDVDATASPGLLWGVATPLPVACVMTRAAQAADLAVERASLGARPTLRPLVPLLSRHGCACF